MVFEPCVFPPVAVSKASTVAGTETWMKTDGEIFRILFSRRFY